MPLFLGDVITGQDKALTAIQPGSINGTVTYSGGTTPVADAIVTFTPPGSSKPLIATTDANGNYNIATAPAGTYSATAVGMTNKHGNVTAARTAPVNVTVQADTPVTQNFTLTLIPPTFAGTVISAKDGTALQNALITVTDAVTGAIVGTASTDASGTYTTAGTVPLQSGGVYTIVASLARYQSITALDPFTPGSQSTKITFYNGDTVTGQKFQLTPLKPGTVTGNVTDNTGAVVPGATVTLTSTDKTIVLTAVTDGNGAYAIPVNTVPAGSYSGTVIGPTNTNGKPEYTAPPAQSVTVSPNTTTTANFTLTQILPTFAVTVTDAAGGAPLTNATVTFTPAAGGASTIVTANVAGVYTSPGLAPGVYTITATASGFFDGVNSAGVELGDTNTPVALVLNEKATVYGLITDSVTGAPLSGVTLTVTNAGGGTAVNTTPSHHHHRHEHQRRIGRVASELHVQPAARHVHADRDEGQLYAVDLCGLHG